MNIKESIANVATTRPQSFLAAVRDDLQERREARAADRQLRRELSTYTTHSEIDDLSATFSRYDEDAVAPLREILNHNLMNRRAS